MREREREREWDIDFGVDSNFGIRNDILYFIIGGEFEVVIVLDGELLSGGNFLFADKFISDEGFEFLDGFDFKDELVFVFDGSIGVELNEEGLSVLGLH